MSEVKTKKSKMNSNLAMALLGLVLLLVALVRAVQGELAEKAARPRWEIVCNAAGQFSFLDGEGELFYVDYPTRAEAEAVMAQHKVTMVDYDPSGTAARQRARERSYKPCATEPEAPTVPRYEWDIQENGVFVERPTMTMREASAYADRWPQRKLRRLR